MTNRSIINKPSRFLFTLLVSLIAGLLVAGIVMAWTNPTANPPSGGGALYYYNGNVGIGTTGPGYKLAVQGGDINTSGKIKEGGNNLIPAGSVMFFNLAVCPAGWTELTAAQGRYLVGLPSGGTLAGTSGTALTNLESRATGAHSHSVTDPGHQHAYSHYANIASLRGFPDLTPIEQVGWSGASTGVGVTGITIGTSGSTAGTNAPYMQLLVCSKN